MKIIPLSGKVRHGIHREIYRDKRLTRASKLGNQIRAIQNQTTNSFRYATIDSSYGVHGW